MTIQHVDHKKQGHVGCLLHDALTTNLINLTIGVHYHVGGMFSGVLPIIFGQDVQSGFEMCIFFFLRQKWPIFVSANVTYL